MAGVGRKRNGGFGVIEGNKQTLAYGDCQRHSFAPSLLFGQSVLAGASDPKRSWPAVFHRYRNV